MKQTEYQDHAFAYYYDITDLSTICSISVSTTKHPPSAPLQSNFDPLGSRFLRQFSQMKIDEQPQVVGRRREKSNNVYNKEWIDKSVEEGSIRCYSENNITMGHMPIAGGAYGVVYKAMMKHNKITVAIKTLFQDPHGCEEKFYRIKEVVFLTFSNFVMYNYLHIISNYS